MDGKRKKLPFNEVGSGRMRFAPVKDRCRIEKKKGSATTKGRPTSKKKARSDADVKARGGCLRFKLGGTSPEGAIQFCKELTHADQDSSWPEISCQAGRNESSSTTFLGPPCTPCNTSNAAASEGNSSLSMERLPVATCSSTFPERGDDKDKEKDDKGDSDVIDDGVGASADVACADDEDDDWFDVVVRT